MDRREMLANTLAKATATSSTEGIAKTDAVFNQYANAILPKRAAIAAGLEPYTGVWNSIHAQHLLRRTLFGFSKTDLEKALALTAATAVEALLDIPDEVIAPPLVTNTNDTVPVGETWVTAAYDGTLNNLRGRSLQSWWMGLIANQNFSIREKMVLFWHNQLPTEIQVTGDSRMSYIQNVLFRKFAVGNFKELIKQITLDPAMLRYLNGNSNTNKNPNENYGRELQELFTVGKGPEISVGNYTFYTEEDVKAAARVLTGWKDSRANLSTVFEEKNHDITDKSFSSAYGNRVIKGRSGPDGALEVDDLLDMIFSQIETSRYLVRKLYRFFVYYVIDAETEKNIILPLADEFQKNGFKVKPILATLFKSAHFHDPLNQGCSIKNPLDLVVGTFRQLEASRPEGTDPVNTSALWSVFVTETSRMQMEIGEPPNVAGWPAYYQTPVFYELWINSDTLPRRVQFTDRIITTKGYTFGGGKFSTIIDVIALAKQTTNPGTVADLVSDLSARLFPITLTKVQLKYLKDVMMAGLPDYEWTAEWNDFLAAPTDVKLRSAVEIRLRALFKAMLQLAEYQLC
jgi:uncharacterized protein (DUF1800 family)